MSKFWIKFFCFVGGHSRSVFRAGYPAGSRVYYWCWECTRCGQLGINGDYDGYIKVKRNLNTDKADWRFVKANSNETYKRLLETM